jgi:integrase
MPRPRWPHLLREVSRHGTVRWVVRIGRGPRTPITARYGSPEFEAAYHAAIRGEVVLARPKRQDGTLAWLVARYQGSSAWAGLAKATQKQRANILKHVLESAGDMPIAEIARTHIIDGRERRAHTPSQANNFLNTMRYLFKWAIEQEYIDKDPTDGVKNVKRPKGGFHPWTEDEIAAFESRWPIGTRERLALEIFLCTGLRRGDAAKLGRQHIKDGVILIRAEKTGAQLAIPVLPELEAAILATPTGNLSLIATASGRPMVKEGFGNWFKDACMAAGVPGSAHGLRKAAAARLANAGVTEAELDAIMGWTPGSGMSRIYTRTRDNARLAAQAIEKLKASKKRTLYSQPNHKVGKERNKSQ